MKKTMRTLTAFSIVLLVMVSCKKIDEQHQVYLHLQGGFSGDDVKIEVDGNQVYHNGSVVTNNLLSLADVDSTLQPNGDHLIKVDVNHGFIHTSHFNLLNTLYVGINLNPEDSNITIQYANEPFMYE